MEKQNGGRQPEDIAGKERLHIEILCTIGPASMKTTVLKRLDDLPVSLLRINLSHTSLADLPEHIRFIQGNSAKPICLDTEGSQIRTGKMKGGQVLLQEGRFVNIHRDTAALGDEENIHLYPPEALGHIRLHDLICLDFHSALLQVVEKGAERLRARVITEGLVGNNKAVSLNRSLQMDPLTRKDRAAVQTGLAAGIKHFALSFANRVEDVRELRRLVGKSAFIISKIESHSGLTQLTPIARESDAILIDRGDLSREEPIEAIPLLQKHIIRTAKAVNTRVYVATNLLESMVTQAKPTRAEVNDVLNTLIDGADGLVLAAETAIGANPVGCVNMIAKMIDQYRNYSRFGIEPEKYDLRSLLAAPHGGHLVNRVLPDPDMAAIASLPVLTVDERVVLDCEQIACGVYSPLTGFMTRDELENVLEHHRLLSGVPWTLPIVLLSTREKTARLKRGDALALADARTGERFAVLRLDDIAPLAADSVVRRWFGADSPRHPGVAYIQGAGDVLLGGQIDLLRFSAKEPRVASYLLTPQDTRFIFEQRNWFRVVGFHSRNVVHRGHEFIQRQALENHHCDGLFISPVVGPKRESDFKSEAVLNSYQTLINAHIYPKNKAMIGAFMSYPRYAGPREAVFTAICRKNFGCSHFVVGRDHTGVGDFYPADGAIRLFEKTGDLGITPVFFGEVAYCEDCSAHRITCAHPETSVKRLSGTLLRQMLVEGKMPPSWLVREEVAAMLLAAAQSGDELFL